MNSPTEQNGADQNGTAGTENQNSTQESKLETVSNLKFELVNDTDHSLSIIAGLGEPVIITELSDAQLATRCQQLGEFFQVLSGRMTLHAAWLAGEAFSEEHRRLEVNQTKKGKPTSHGTWMKHLRTNFPTLNDRTIRLWIGVFKNKEKLQGANILKLTEAYKQVKQWNALANGKDPKPEKTPEQLMGDVIAKVKKFTVANPDSANELFGHLAELQDKKSTLAVAKSHIQHCFETFSGKDIVKLQAFIDGQVKARQEADQAPSPVATGTFNPGKKRGRKSNAQKAAEEAARKEETSA